MDRRHFIMGSAFLGATLAAPAIAAQSAKRRFRIIRDGDDIGTHDLEAVLTGNGFEIDVTIRIAVKFLGVTAYRYEMNNREVWRGGRIVSVDSRVNDDGTQERARVTARPDTLTIDGSRYSGKASVEAATTSYYAPAFLKRSPWISTQSGDILKVAVNPEGRANWWKISGGLDTTLGYDARGEWTGCEFDAGGELATYEVTHQSGAIGALWAAA